MPGTDPNSMDAKLADIADNADQLHFSSVAPASLTPGGDISGSLGFVALSLGDGNGDWSIGAGIDSGDRKLTLESQEITTNAEGGTVLTIIAYDSGNARIKHFWDATIKVLNGATAYTVPELTINDDIPVNI